MRLHITNGDCAGDMLAASTLIEGDILCWRDLLHDGPVMALPYADYSAQRTEFLLQLLERGACEETVSAEQIAADFVQRDEILSRITAYDEVVLWFEHDLYDQLQLIEVCKRISDKGALPLLSIVSIDRHPDVPFFLGFGNLSIEMMDALFIERLPLSLEQLEVGCSLWLQLTDVSPEALAASAQKEIEGWPYMAKALRRFCLEFPALETGLTLTQTYLLLTLLKAPDELPALEFNLKWAEQNQRLPVGETATQRYYEILAGPATFKRIFNHLQQLEVDPFMGDLSVRCELNRLINADLPYVSCVGQGEDAVYSLTHAGAEALQGQRHWLRDNDIDVWRGGVHLTSDNLWLWDQHKKCFRFNELPL